MATANQNSVAVLNILWTKVEGVGLDVIAKLLVVMVNKQRVSMWYEQSVVVRMGPVVHAAALMLLDLRVIRSLWRILLVGEALWA